MAKVLVLNATFEPLGVVPVRRAVCLMLANKVELLHDSGRLVRSEQLAIAEPSVVRLSRYVKIPYAPNRSPSRHGVFSRDSYRCQYCGARAETVDHVVPRSRGGCHAWDNVVAACRRCNARKSDRLLPETTMRLSRPPAPAPPGYWIGATLGSMPVSWLQYLTDQRRSA